MSTLQGEPGIVGIGPVTVADTWLRDPVSIWNGSKVTLYVRGGQLRIRLSRSMPPEPPTWDQPFTLNAGPWSHVGPFGYVDFQNAVAGQAPTVVSGAAYRE